MITDQERWELCKEQLEELDKKYRESCAADNEVACQQYYRAIHDVRHIYRFE